MDENERRRIVAAARGYEQAYKECQARHAEYIGSVGRGDIVQSNMAYDRYKASEKRAERHMKGIAGLVHTMLSLGILEDETIRVDDVVYLVYSEDGFWRTNLDAFPDLAKTHEEP